MREAVRSEAELIEIYLRPLAGAEGLGLSDDAALIAADGHHDLVVTTDPVRTGVHFFADDAPGDIAWKALAVNVSDLIAKGAEPFAYTMALAFPSPPEHDWMAAFSAGLGRAQAAFGCRLIGGDTDHGGGPFSVSITAFGLVPRGEMVRRLTARAGDRVFVVGTIGDAALGLILRRDALAFGADLAGEKRAALIGRYLRPEPDVRVATVVRLAASAALDVSDGLVQDAAKLAGGAGCGLDIAYDDIPLSAAGRDITERFIAARTTIISGGDDYRVLMAVPPERVDLLRGLAAEAGITASELGVLAEGSGVRIRDRNGHAIAAGPGGYDHFRRS